MCHNHGSTRLQLLILLLFTCNCLASDPIPVNGTDPDWLGRPVLEVLETYSDRGFELIFSTSLVPPGMIVLTEPRNREPLQLIEEILQPHGLTLKRIGDKHLVTKTQSGSDEKQTASLFVIILNAKDLNPPENLAVWIKPKVSHQDSYGPGIHAFSPIEPGKYTIKAEFPGYLPSISVVDIQPGETEMLNIELQLGLAVLEDMNVSASRYVLASNSQYYLDQQAILALPVLGGDPIRAVQRLQGAASSGLSSMAHLRGGLQSENGIYLNGLKMLEPFHIRDYHSIFSFIDSLAISGIQVYTGGFPAEYGDDMSGVLLLDSIPPEEPLQTTLGVSFFNASLLNSGH